MQGFGGRLLRLVTLGLWGLGVAQARNYYVSPGGSDGAPGTLDQPFKTIQEAASVMVPGDTAYIRAGIYRETVTPRYSGTPTAPITFLPYDGESVTVSGADAIAASSWTLSGGHVYKAPMNWNLGEGANQVFLDGQMMIEARWPNTTLDVSHPAAAHTRAGSFGGGETGLSMGKFTDPNLPDRPPDYWSGATIHASLGAGWLWQTGNVVNSAPGEISFTFTHMSSLEPGTNNPYYLSGKIDELDAAGEWFLDTNSSELYFWTPGSDSPAQHQVEAKRRGLAFELSGHSFITVQGLNIFAAGVNTDSSTQYVVLDGLNIQYVSHYSLIPGQPYYVGVGEGVVLNGSNNVLRNSSIAFSAGNGVVLNGSGHRVFNNVIHDADYTPTYASPVFAGPIASNGLVVAWNTIYNSGRFGINHSHFTHGRILHNEIFNVGIQTSDLGGTYTWQSDGNGSEIAYNLLHDNFGLSTCYYSRNCNGVGLYLDAGIYLDSGSSNYAVHHNVVWSTPTALILNSPSTNNKVYDNTFIGSNQDLGGVYGVRGRAVMFGTELKNNMFTNRIPPTPGAVVRHNVRSATGLQFLYQLKLTSPAVGGGIEIPSSTVGLTGRAPHTGAYGHGKPAWRAGAQAAAYTASAVDGGPGLAPGSPALVVGTVPFDSRVSVMVTDGSGGDLPATVLFSIASPPQLLFEVPAAAAPGVAMITITNGDGTVSLSSAPVFPGSPAQPRRAPLAHHRRWGLFHFRRGVSRLLRFYIPA